jgi:hypothetical protein
LRKQKNDKKALSIEQRAKVFCQTFNAILEANTVNRMGFLALGYVDGSDQTNVFSAAEHCESDGEHMISFVWAAWLMGALFKDELPGFKPGKVKYIGSLHDIAEAKIGGDIPDDGNKRCLNKDEIELRAFAKLLKDLPKKSRKKAIKAFKKFQKKDDYAYVIDKMLFPMVQLWRIKKGWPEGSMKIKEKQGMLTGSDAEFIEAVGSDAPAVVTTAHALTITKGKPGFKVASAILKAQFAEAKVEIPDALMSYF